MCILLHAAKLAKTFSIGEGADSSPPKNRGASKLTVNPFSFLATKR